MKKVDNSISDNLFKRSLNVKLRAVNNQLNELKPMLEPRRRLQVSILKYELIQLHKTLIQLEKDNAPLKDQYKVVDTIIEKEKAIADIQKLESVWDKYYKLEAKKQGLLDLIESMER